MVKCLKPGKVVVILSGKYAGKKAVIVKVYEEGNGKYKFPHALVCGVARPPRKVTRRMNEKKVDKKTTMQVFTKVINLQHFMPTRFTFFQVIILDTTWSSISLSFLRMQWILNRRRLLFKRLPRLSSIRLFFLFLLRIDIFIRMKMRRREPRLESLICLRNSTSKQVVAMRCVDLA